MIGGLRGFDFPGPPRNHGDANATFVKVTFSAAKRTAGIKAGSFMTALLHGSVVTGEHDEGIFGDAEVVKLFEEKSHVVIHVRDHGCIGRLRFTFVGIMRVFFSLGEQFFFENGTILLLPFLLRAEAGVRDLEGEMEKKRTVFLLFDILEGFFRDDLGGVMVACVKGVAGVLFLLGVSPKIIGIEEVGVDVGSVAEEEIEAFVEDEGGVIGIAAEARLTDQSGVVARFLKSSWEDGVVGIAAHLNLTISTNVGVAGVLPLEETTAGGSADGASGVVTGEANSLGSHLIEIGSLNDFLPVTTEVSVSEIVCENVNDVGLGCT